jgi:hypothetical protein
MRVVMRILGRLRDHFVERINHRLQVALYTLNNPDRVLSSLDDLVFQLVGCIDHTRYQRERCFEHSSNKAPPVQILRRGVL